MEDGGDNYGANILTDIDDIETYISKRGHQGEDGVAVMK